MVGNQGNHKGCPYELGRVMQERPLWAPLPAETNTLLEANHIGAFCAPAALKNRLV